MRKSTFLNLCKSAMAGCMLAITPVASQAINKPADALEAIVFEDSLSAQNYRQEYQPPSLEEIFNDWPRFNGTSFYEAAADAVGDAAAWYYDAGSERFIQPNNSGSPTGFISLDKYTDYDFEAMVTSFDFDDDAIGLVLAFNDMEYLAAVRTHGGTQVTSGWGVIHTTNGSMGWRSGNTVASKSIQNDYGWLGSYTKIKVRKRGNTIELWTSQWNSEEIDESTKLVINLSAYPGLQSETSYGYYTLSQAGANFYNVKFVDQKPGVNRAELLDLEANSKWVFDGQAQSWGTDGNASDAYPLGTKLWNPDSLEAYKTDTTVFNYDFQEGGETRTYDCRGKDRNVFSSVEEVEWIVPAEMDEISRSEIGITLRANPVYTDSSKPLQCRVRTADGWSPYYTRVIKLPPLFNTPDAIINSGESLALVAEDMVADGAHSVSWMNIGGDDGNLTISSDEITTPEFFYPEANRVYKFNALVEDAFRTAVKTKTVYVNSKPLVTLDADFRPNAGQTVDITCNGSDTESVVEYEWRNEGADSGDFTLTNTQVNSITIPAGATHGEFYKLSCRVKDNRDLWSQWQTATLQTNLPPTAVATYEPNVDLGFVSDGDTITLKGEDSFDSAFDPVGYRGIASFTWEQIAGEPVTISDINAENPTFAVPAVADVANLVLTFKLTVTDLGGMTDSTVVSMNVNQTPTLDAFPPQVGYRSYYLMNESAENSYFDLVMTATNPDDGDLHIPGVNEVLSISWTAEKVNDGDGQLFFDYDSTDVNGQVRISTNNLTTETDFLVRVLVIDKYGAYAEETFELKVNPLPEFRLTGDALVHELDEGQVHITDLSDVNGSIANIHWEFSDRDGVIFSQSEAFNTNLSYRFTSEDIVVRKFLTLKATVTDDMGGTVSKEFDVSLNARPYVSVGYTGSTMEDGTFFLPTTGEFNLNTGDGDITVGENGSFDVDGHIANIQWELIDGPSDEVSWEVMGTAESYDNLPDFLGGKDVFGVANLAGGRWTWKVTVTDNDGATSEDVTALYVNSKPSFNLKGDAISLRYGVVGYAQIEDLIDADGEITSIQWRQVGGPTITYEQTGTIIEFQTLYRLSGNQPEEIVMEVSVTDDLNVTTVQELTIPIRDDFYGCGDVANFPDGPADGTCERDVDLTYGVAKVNSCPTMVANMWIPASLDEPVLRSQLTAQCEERTSYECKICIPEPVEDKYEECQLLPYMMPPKKLPYYKDGDVIKVDDTLDKRTYKGTPLPTGEWNIDGPELMWNMTQEEYETAYADRKGFPASRCLDITNHEHEVAVSVGGLKFQTKPEIVAGAITPLDVIPCWNWDLMYRCTEPVVNTCSDWADANSFVGAVPVEWTEKGRTDTVVDNYLYWLFSSRSEGLAVDGVPRGSILQQKIHFTSNERWKMTCKNKETGEDRQDLADVFCPVNEADPFKGPLLSACLPGATQRIISLGAMPLDADGNVVEESVQRCVEQVERTSACQYNATASQLTALEALSHYGFNERSLVTLEAETMINQPACAVDLNNDGAPIMDIKDNPYVLNADWDDETTVGPDDCYKWEADWLFYSGEKFQWCTLNCGDGTQGVQQELVACELIDPTMKPIPEWEQWGTGWSQCAAPVIRTICPADAQSDITIGGEPGGEGDLNGMVCSEPQGMQEKTLTGEIIKEEVTMECYDESESVATCIPDPNCSLVSVDNVNVKENGLFEHQYQEYVCTKRIETCEKTVEKQVCSDQEDFLVTPGGNGNFEKAVAAAKTIEAVDQGVDFHNGQIRIFQGNAVKCEPWTSDAVALYNFVSAALVAVDLYSGGTASYLSAALGAAEMLSSQEYLNQKTQCCHPNPDVTGKRVNVESISTMAINAVLGSESQGKVPACSGQEIKLANKRWMDYYNGHQIAGSYGGYYYEGAAMRRDGVMSPATQKDKTLSLLITEITLTRQAHWCTFDNVLARIIQMYGRQQLNELAASGAAGAIDAPVSFSVMGSETDYGWKMVHDDINGNEMAVYQWNPICFTEASNEAVQRGEVVCPYDYANVWTAYCSAGAECNLNQLINDPADPTDDWDPRNGLKDKWDVVYQKRDDLTLSAMTQFVVKKGLCDDTGVCNWNMFAWPGGGASSNIVYDHSFPIYSETGGWSEEFHIGDKMTYQFEMPKLGDEFPAGLRMRFKAYDSSAFDTGEVVLPMEIDDVTGYLINNSGGIRMYGGCDQAKMGCGFRFVVPVSISAIPHNSCSGFSIDQMMVLDFSKMDFGEYIDSFVAKVEDVQLSEEEIANIGMQMVTAFTGKVVNGDPLESDDGMIIGTFNELRVSGPEMVTLEINQQLPGTHGFVESIDINWGDGSERDLNINPHSLMQLWDEREAQAVNEFNTICVPRWQNYLLEVDRLEAEKNLKWEEFHLCVTGGTSSVQTGYTVDDLTNMNIGTCTDEYEVFDNAYDVWVDYTCRANEDGTESCGNTAMEEKTHEMTCRVRKDSMIQSRAAYYQEYQYRIDNSIQTIQYEHMQLPVSEDKIQEVDVTLYLSGGGTKNVKGYLANYTGAINTDDATLTPSHIKLNVGGAAPAAGSVNRPGFLVDSVGDAPNPLPGGSISQINAELGN